MLARRLSRNPKPLRRIRPNAAPFVVGLVNGQAFGEFSCEQLTARANLVRSDGEFLGRLLRLSVREETLPSDHVEEQIYDGFPSQADTALMARFHVTEWCDRFQIVEEFQDQRFRCLGRRLIYAHCPESLPDDVRREEARLLAARLTGHGCDAPPWKTLEAADLEAAEMEQDGHPDHVEMLRGFRGHIADLLRKAADAVA